MGRATGNCTIFFTLAALAVFVCCSQLESIDRRAAAELLEYIDLKKSLLRRVRVEVQRLAPSYLAKRSTLDSKPSSRDKRPDSSSRSARLTACRPTKTRCSSGSSKAVFSAWASLRSAC